MSSGKEVFSRLAKPFPLAVERVVLSAVASGLLAGKVLFLVGLGGGNGPSVSDVRTTRHVCIFLGGRQQATSCSEQWKSPCLSFTLHFNPDFFFLVRVVFSLLRRVQIAVVWRVC